MLSLKLVCVDTGRTVCTSECRAGTARIEQVTFSRDGRLIAVLSRHRAWVVDRLTGQRLLEASMPKPFHWRSAALLADGRLLLAGEHDDGPAVLDLFSGERLWARTQLRDVSALALSPNGRTLAVGQRDTSILIYDVERPKRPKQAEPDAKKLKELWDALASANAVRAWKAARQLEGHPASAVSLLGEQLKPTPATGPSRLLSDL